MGEKDSFCAASEEKRFFEGISATSENNKQIP